MRIDDLAAKAGVPTRTIRYYTQQGLLPSPTLKGRIGYYDDTHLDRLRLIKELQEKRFLPLSVIRSLIRHLEEGADLDTMLTPLDLVFAPRWDATEQHTYTRDALLAEAGVSEKVLRDAEDMGFLVPLGRGSSRRYTSDDVQLLEVAARWMELGLPHELGRLYRESLEEISKHQVRAFNDCIVAPLVTDGVPPEEAQERLVDGYRELGNVFTKLAALLHRKMLQKAVEFYAAAEKP